MKKNWFWKEKEFLKIKKDFKRTSQAEISSFSSILMNKTKIIGRSKAYPLCGLDVFDHFSLISEINSIGEKKKF